MQNKNPETQRGDVHAYTRGDASIDAQHAVHMRARIRALHESGRSLLIPAGKDAKHVLSDTAGSLCAGDRPCVALLGKKIFSGKTR